MTIIKKKGEWQFGYKDTWSLDCSLSPIIAAGLTKFHDVLKEKNAKGGCIGIPNGFMKNEEEWVTDSDIQDWLDTLQQMIYAFQDNAPEIKDFHFSFNIIEVEDATPIHGCSKPYHIEPTNQEAYDAFRAAEKEHQERVQKGLELFAKHYKDLWH